MSNSTSSHSHSAAAAQSHADSADAQAESYDAVPYVGSSCPESHPDALATMATLFGLKPTPIQQARVLELGCGTGWNILPIAQNLPNTQFTGIDVSARQIDIGRDLAKKLELNNLDLRVMDLQQIDDAFGQFDYIICHGVYSWVDQPTQTRILEICKNNLTPQGVAYISYNTMPGWHAPLTLRDAMRHHVADITDPQRRVTEALMLVKWMIDNDHSNSPAWQATLAEEARELENKPEWYITHEYLNDHNSPCYFHEFNEAIQQHGLTYLSESSLTEMAAHSLDEAGRKAIKQLSPSIIDAEQNADYLRKRRFRKTLVCHESAAIDRDHVADRLVELHLTTALQPQTLNAQSLISNDTVTFISPDQQRTMTAGAPLLKLSLLALSRAHPQPLTVDNLLTQINLLLNECGANAVPINDELHNALKKGLYEMLRYGGITAMTYAPPLTTTVSQCPRASSIARYQAQRGPTVTNLLHYSGHLDIFGQQIVPLLDGTRDLEEITQIMTDLILGGGITLANADNQSVSDPDDVENLVKQTLDHAMPYLARNALLVA